MLKILRLGGFRQTLLKSMRQLRIVIPLKRYQRNPIMVKHMEGQVLASAIESATIEDCDSIPLWRAFLVRTSQLIPNKKISPHCISKCLQGFNSALIAGWLSRIDISYKYIESIQDEIEKALTSTVKLKFSTHQQIAHVCHFLHLFGGLNDKTKESLFSSLRELSLSYLELQAGTDIFSKTATGVVPIKDVVMLLEIFLTRDDRVVRWVISKTELNPTSWTPRTLLCLFKVALVVTFNPGSLESEEMLENPFDITLFLLTVTQEMVLHTVSLLKTLESSDTSSLDRHQVCSQIQWIYGSIVGLMKHRHAIEEIKLPHLPRDIRYLIMNIYHIMRTLLHCEMCDIPLDKLSLLLKLTILLKSWEGLPSDSPFGVTVDDSLEKYVLLKIRMTINTLDMYPSSFCKKLMELLLQVNRIPDEDRSDKKSSEIIGNMLAVKSVFSMNWISEFVSTYFQHPPTKCPN